MPKEKENSATYIAWNGKDISHLMSALLLRAIEYCSVLSSSQVWYLKRVQLTKNMDFTGELLVKNYYWRISLLIQPKMLKNANLITSWNYSLDLRTILWALPDEYCNKIVHRVEGLQSFCFRKLEKNILEVSKIRWHYLRTLMIFTSQ